MRSLLNPLIEPLGYQLFRTGPKSLGLSPFRDMQRLASTAQPVVFDVGANVGQTVAKIRKQLSNPVVHCFEPTPTTFAQLTKRCGKLNNVYLNNVGLADRVGELELYKLESSEMNSFLLPLEDARGDVVAREVVPVTTIDEHCAQHSIEHIDVLKIDAQGFDLDVIKGARQMIAEHRVHLIYLELIFSRMYERVPRLDEIYGHLANSGFELVCFYRFSFQHDRAAVSDAMFVNPRFGKPARALTRACA